MTGLGSRRDRWLISALVWLVFVAVANTTATAVAQPDIERVFGATPAQVGAVIYAYVGAFAVATALYGRLGDRWGRTRTLVGGASIMALGAVAAAVAPTVTWLVAARVVQGLGAGAVPTLALSILSQRLQGLDRARAFGLYIAGVGFGHAAGPLIGGMLIDLVSWRAAVALGVLALPGALIALRIGPAGQRSRNRIDITGGALLLAAIVLGTWLISRIAALAFSPGTLLGLLLTGALSVALWWHLRRHPTPFIPREVSTSRPFWRLAYLGGTGMSLFLGIVTGVPLVLGEGGRLTGVSLGLLLVPMALAIALTSPRNGGIVARLGREWTTLVSLSSLVVGALVATALASQGTPLAVAVSLVLVGAGFGLLNAPLSREVTEMFADDMRPIALASFNVAFFGSGAVGSAIVAGSVAAWPDARGLGMLIAVALLSLPALVGALGCVRRGRDI